MTPDPLLSLLDLSPGVRRRALRRLSRGPGLFALRTVLCFDPHAGVRAAAASHLGHLGGPEPCRWLLFALGDPSPLVRFCALRSLARLDHRAAVVPLVSLLRADPCWWVRRAAAFALAAFDDSAAVDALRASLDDPVWRVRLGVVQALALTARHPERRSAVLAPLTDAPLHAHLAREHLVALLSGTIPSTRTLASSASALSSLEDDDPAVTAARLASLQPGSVEPSRLLHLIADPHAPLRDQALRHLAGRLDAATLADLQQRYRDPRVPHGAAALRRLLGLRPPALPRSSPGSLALPTLDDPWTRLASLDLPSARRAIEEDPDPWVRRRAASLLAPRHLDPAALPETAAALARSADAFLRIQAANLLGHAEGSIVTRLGLFLYGDPAPAVRAAALDVLARIAPSEVEAALRGDTLGETERRSALLWLGGIQGKHEALDLARGPGEERLVALLRGELSPPVTGPLAAPEAPVRWRAGEAPRAVLGASGVSVARLVLSGRNEPPVRGLVEAHERGVDAFFWEPGYLNLTRFLRDRRLGRRAVIAGTYHADRGSIERDVDAALRRLRAESIEVFLLFWARSPARLTGEPKEALLRLKERGKVRAVGFSTHLRGVAGEALERGGWDVMMTRHSAAHRGAEGALFPRALALGVGVLSFSNLGYGRLLAPVPGAETTPVSAADCYRYSLAAPGVSASVSAPRSLGEIREGLRALEEPGLPEDTRARLLAHGDAVYALSQHRNGLVRQAPTEHRYGVRSLALDELDLSFPAAEAPREARLAAGHTLQHTSSKRGVLARNELPSE